MKTSFITTGVDRLNYPIGHHINDNKDDIEKLAKALGKIYPKDINLNLICRGSSGAIIAGMFVLLLPNHCKIIHIKKEGESSHSNYFDLDASGKVVIVDDFIISCDTIKSIYNSLIIKYPDIKIDCLCLSGHRCCYLPFTPKYYICY